MMANGTHDSGSGSGRGRTPSFPFPALPPEAPTPPTTEELVDALVARLSAQTKRSKRDEDDAGFWAWIPPKARSWVAILAILVGTSSASILAQARAIGGLPDEVTQIKQDLGKIKELLQQAPSSRSQR